jgi:hypothetical protein
VASGSNKMLMSSASLAYYQTYCVYLLYTSSDSSMIVLARFNTCSHLKYLELMSFWQVDTTTFVKKNSTTSLPLRMDSIGCSSNRVRSSFSSRRVGIVYYSIAKEVIRHDETRRCQASRLRLPVSIGYSIISVIFWL